KGGLGLAAAQAYIQSTTPPTPSVVATPSAVAALLTPDKGQAVGDQSAGDDASGQSTPEDTSGALPSFQMAASYGQMLAAQEAGTLAAPTVSRPSQAAGAYSATLALTDEPSGLDLE